MNAYIFHTVPPWELNPKILPLQAPGSTHCAYTRPCLLLGWVGVFTSNVNTVIVFLVGRLRTGVPFQRPSLCPGMTSVVLWLTFKQTGTVVKWTSLNGGYRNGALDIHFGWHVFYCQPAFPWWAIIVHNLPAEFALRCWGIFLDNIRKSGEHWNYIYELTNIYWK